MKFVNIYADDCARNRRDLRNVTNLAEISTIVG